MSRQLAFDLLLDALTLNNPLPITGEAEDLALLHDLAGSIYNGKTDGPRVQSQWQQQRLENALLFTALEELEAQCVLQKLRVTRLKGAALIPRFYPDPGRRHLCDVDLLVAPSDLMAVESLLLGRGYKYQPVIQWRASAYRRAWTKLAPGNIPVSIDLHTRLWWNQVGDLNSRIVPDPNGFWRLEDGLELLHLVINWVEQDNCISLAKLRDLHLWISSAKINFEEWFAMAETARHWRSISVVRLLLKSLFAFDWHIPNLHCPLFDRLIRGLLDKSVFYEPRPYSANYLALKHLVRPMSEILLYDVLWLQAYARPLARRFLHRLPLPAQSK